MSVTIRPFQLLLASPLSTARGTIDTREGFIYDIEAGQRGLGEACPLYPFTEDRSECHEALRRAADAYDSDGWAGAFRHVSVTDGRKLSYPAARHAVSLAFLDSQARAAGMPLYRKLSREPRKGTVPVNATIGDISRADTLDRGKNAANEGFPAIKVKVGGRDLGSDVERILSLRDTLGPEVAIRADANGAWSLNQAREFIERTVQCDLDYVEQPLDPGEIEGHANLRGRGVDIALDESLGTDGVQASLDADAADVFIIKPMATGGVDVARSVARDITRKGYRAVFSTTIDSVVARTAAAHAAASLPDIPPSGLATGGFLAEDLAADPAPIQGGMIELPDCPGLGIQEVQIR